MNWLLLALKSAKFGKILASSGSMIVSVFAYGLIFGFPYAVGFVILLLAHEMGHYAAARQRSLKVGLPAFIPFVGAWIQLKEIPHDVETEAYVGLAGPVTGTVAALLCYFLARNSGSSLLLALSYAGFMINLFNLLPVSPLDGGRITAVISRKIWWFGAPLLVLLFIMTHSPVLLLVAILGIPQLIASWRKTPDDQYYEASPEHKVTYGIWYLGLAGLLGVMSYEVHQMIAA